MAVVDDDRGLLVVGKGPWRLVVVGKGLSRLLSPSKIPPRILPEKAGDSSVTSFECRARGRSAPLLLAQGWTGWSIQLGNLQQNELQEIQTIWCDLVKFDARRQSWLVLVSFLILEAHLISISLCQSACFPVS